MNCEKKINIIYIFYPLLKAIPDNDEPSIVVKEHSYNRAFADYAPMADVVSDVPPAYNDLSSAVDVPLADVAPADDVPIADVVPDVPSAYNDLSSAADVPLADVAPADDVPIADVVPDVPPAYNDLSSAGDVPLADVAPADNVPLADVAPDDDVLTIDHANGLGFFLDNTIGLEVFMSFNYD
jgi:hypothetical protein